MAWLERKEDWLGRRKDRSGEGKKRENGEKQRRPEKMYSIAEVAEILSVSKQTVNKWMSRRNPDEAVIPRTAWVKLPNGHIRIREWIVLKLQAGEI